jgi:hypothetical protein
VADLAKFDEAYKATAPEKVRDVMSDEALDMHHRYFVDILPDVARVAGAPWMKPAAEGRIAILAAELHQRRMEERLDRHHEASFGLGKKTHTATEKILCWTKWVFAAAVIIPIAVALIQEILTSKTHLSIPSQSPQESPANAGASPQEQQISAPPSVSPTASQTPSMTSPTP